MPSRCRGPRPRSRTSRSGIQRIARSANSTVGTFTSIMPSVVPATTCSSCVVPGREGHRHHLGLVAHFGKKERHDR